MKHKTLPAPIEVKLFVTLIISAIASVLIQFLIK